MRGRLRGRSRFWRDAAIVAVVVFVIGLPSLLGNDGFAMDYTNHLWLVWVQGKVIAAGGAPSYFFQAPIGGGLFYPFFMFYGGTLYSVTAAFAALLGGRPLVAYIAVNLMSIAAAYGGSLWLARQLGVRSWMAHAPALVFVTSAYYVANLYGRGAWPEFVAVSAIPLAIAGGVRIARAPHLEPLPCALFAGAVIIWSGSHNITLLWGAVMALVTLVALRLILRRPLATGRAQLVRLGVVFGLAVCCNAWFLLPDILYAGTTAIAHAEAAKWEYSRVFNAPGLLLNPLRSVPDWSETRALYVQLPVWGLAWALAVAFVLRGRVSRLLRRAGLAVALVLAALLAVIMVGPVYEALPEPLRVIQWVYRLVTYASLLIAGLVLVAVLAVESSEESGRRRVLKRVLAVTLSVSAALCMWQLWVPQTHHKLSYNDPRRALVSVNKVPRTWYDAGIYFNRSARIVNTKPDRVLMLDARALSGNDAAVTVTPPPGPEPFAINIVAGPEYLRLGGVERLGRRFDGWMVARRLDGGSGPVQLTVETGGTVVTVGYVLTAVGTIGIVGIILGAGVAGVRRRRFAVRSHNRALSAA